MKVNDIGSRQMSKWLYVIDENLLGGVKTIRVTLRSLKRYDQHVLATISKKNVFIDTQCGKIFIGIDVVFMFVAI
jgi:hypothetical protein